MFGNEYGQVSRGKMEVLSMDEEVVEAAKIASAHSFIEQLENGYDTILEHDGSNGRRKVVSSS